MSDDFENTREGLESPADNAIDIDAELSDSTDLSKVVRAVHVNVGGLIRGILNNDPDDTVLDYIVNGGVLYPYRFRRVFATATTASGLVGVF